MKSLFLSCPLVLLIASCSSNRCIEQPEERSTFFSNVYVEQVAYDTPSDGDLWPSAWSNDDVLYAANGDGKGLDLTGEWADIVVNRIDGHPNHRNVSGKRLASGDSIAPLLLDTATYNRKPTGMVSVDGTLYLAVQYLNKVAPHIFNEVPAASIYRSDDKGKTWRGTAEPLFDNHVFTTIIFLDFGKDGRNNTFDDYVYAYGLDSNWRDSYSNAVGDPDKLYLARVPKNRLQEIGYWEFYVGSHNGGPVWSADIKKRKPVLQDSRRRYPNSPKNSEGMSVISQGGVVYNKPLNRYIYTSWTEFTFEFYESPTPWGPWQLFLSHDFGRYPWNERRYGGYAVVAPSKFISTDGTEMWLSSSTFAGQAHHYNFSLRRLLLTPHTASRPEFPKAGENFVQGAAINMVTPISRGAPRHGDLTYLNDGKRLGLSSYIDSEGWEVGREDYWGYTWNKNYYFNRLAYVTGAVDENDGGWFRDLKVQVRRNFRWEDIKDVDIMPEYPLDGRTESHALYTFDFPLTWGDGVRIVGSPGGGDTYSSISELEVYYVDGSSNERND